MKKNSFTNISSFSSKKHSTQHAIKSLVDNITKSLHSGDIVMGGFFYVKKALDTVKHKILKKMFAYGIRGNILKWFDSYLTIISQFIMYDIIQSATRSIKCGVPQDSILGPFLFVIYMNDICNVCSYCTPLCMVSIPVS